MKFLTCPFNLFLKEFKALMTLGTRTFKKIVGKGNQHLFLFTQSFLPYQRTEAQFYQLSIVVCSSFDFEKVRNLSLRKGLTLSQTSPGFYVSAVQAF